jgi:glycosyltransferase involved in cell wall biosynthesis
VNIHIDNLIYKLQGHGGISRLWSNLILHIGSAMPDATFDLDAPPDVFMSTYYAAAPEGVPSIVLYYDAIHERYPGLGKYHPDAIQKARAVKNAAAVVAISQYSADDCQRYHGVQASVAYCGGSEFAVRGLPEQVALFRMKYGLERPYVLLIGRRDLYKNARALYEAWPLSQWSQQGTVVAVGGEDPLPSDIEFASRYPWKQLRLSDDELALAYSGAHALVYPSYYEGFGLPIVEALASGCPVICGNQSSEPEVADAAALYVDVCKPRDIATALDMLLDPACRFELTMKGYERARMFTWQRMAGSLAEVIRGIA